MRSLKEIKKRAAKAAAVAFLLLGAVGVVSYASEADTAKTPFVLTFNTSTTGVFPRGVSYEGISLEGKTLEEAKSEISDYIEDRQSRYMVWNIVGNTYEYSASSFGVACTNAEIVSSLDNLTMSGNIVEQYKKQKDMDVNPVDLDLQFSLDTQTLHDTISEYTSTLSRTV